MHSIYLVSLKRPCGSLKAMIQQTWLGDVRSGTPSTSETGTTGGLLSPLALCHLSLSQSSAAHNNQKGVVASDWNFQQQLELRCYINPQAVKNTLLRVLITNTPFRFELFKEPHTATG